MNIGYKVDQMKPKCCFVLIKSTSPKRLGKIDSLNIKVQMGGEKKINK